MKYTFSTQAEKVAAIAKQEADHSESQAVHDKHLSDLRAAEIVG